MFVHLYTHTASLTEALCCSNQHYISLWQSKCKSP